MARSQTVVMLALVAMWILVAEGTKKPRMLLKTATRNNMNHVREGGF